MLAIALYSYTLSNFSLSRAEKDEQKYCSKSMQIWASGWEALEILMYLQLETQIQHCEVDGD